MELKLQNGAIFIADAHENGTTRNGFWDFLCEIESGKIECKQLFLMGDIFDLLVGGVKQSEDFAYKYIQKLEKLAKTMQIIYLEGNHDFNLKSLFADVIVVPIENQPMQISFVCDEKIILKIAHGDIFLPKFLGFCLRFLRQKWLIKLLNMVNEKTNSYISSKILKNQNTKNLFYHIDNFEDIAKPRFKRFEADIVIEGHYHQGVFFEWENGKYFNLESFAQKKRYFIVECQANLKKFNLIKKSLKE